MELDKDERERIREALEQAQDGTAQALGMMTESRDFNTPELGLLETELHRVRMGAHKAWSSFTPLHERTR